MSQPKPDQKSLSGNTFSVSNILIIDDTPANLKLLAELLVRQGYKVRPVLNGAQALASVNAMAPDIILLDIKMPGMSGYEVCDALKKNPETRDIPVIFISAMDSVEDKIEAFKAGGIDYITKPFQAEEVLARIKTHLELRRLQISLQDKNNCLKREIAERKATELRLRESERRLRQAHAVGGIGSWEYDLKAEKIWGAEETCRMLGFGQDACFFSVEDLEKRIEEKDRFQSALTRLIEDHDVFNIEFKVRLNNGSRSRFMASKAELIRDDKDSPPKVAGVIQDVTEQKKIGILMRQMHKMESIGTLAGGVAHDINNALGIILGNTEMALDAVSEKEAARDNLQEVLTACLRAKEVIIQLLNFCRRNNHDRSRSFPEKMMADVLKLIRSSAPEKIKIQLNIIEKPAPVFIDPAQFHQIVINICSNAVHAVPESGGNIDITLANISLPEERLVSTGFLKPGDYVQLTVDDTGIGMPPNVIERIFDPYFTTRDFGKGSGMGLSIVHGIVSSLSGGVSVKSSPGKGSRITVFFPAVEQ